MPKSKSSIQAGTPKNFLENLIGWVVDRHFPLFFTLLLLIFTGIYSYYSLAKDVYPESRFPRFQVFADIGFGSIQETELNITVPIEQALRGVPGVESVVSVTERGTATIDLFMNWDTDLDEAYQYVQARINEIRSQLPPKVNLEINRISTSFYPMSEYGIWSEKLSLKELYSYVRYSVVPQLVGVEGVYSLSVIGGLEPEVWIKLNPEALAKYNLDPAMIEEAIRKANQTGFLGKVITHEKMFLGFGGEQLTSLSKIKNIVIGNRMGRAIYLKNIARIEDSHADTRRIVSIDSHKGLFIDVRKQENIDGLKLSGRLDAKFKEVLEQSDQKLHLVKWDLSDFVRESLSSVVISLGLGAILIIFITFYFLNRLRYAMPVILMLPLVVILEFIILKLFRQSINIMTLGGLAASLGILSDNATVLTENFIRAKNSGKKISARKTFVESSGVILPPMIAATFISIVIFFPLGLLGGVPGLFFKSLLFTLASTIVLSLLGTVFITPVLIRYFIGFKESGSGNEEDRKLVKKIGEIYGGLLAKALRHSNVVLAALIATVVLTGGLFFYVPRGFIPESDEGKIVMDYVAPEGISLEQVDVKIGKAIKTIHSIPEVNFLIRKSGTDLSSPYLSANKGEIIIVLKKKRKKDVWQVMEALQSKIEKEFPDIEFDLFQILPDRLGDLTGTRKPILINVIGNDMDENLRLAKKIKQKLKKVKGLSGVLLDMPEATEEVKVEVDGARAQLLGLYGDDVSRYARIALYGEEITSMPIGLQSVPIALTFDRMPHSIGELEQLPVYTPEGGIVKLGNIARVFVQKEYAEHHHKNASPAVSVSAEISRRALSEVVADIKKELAQIKGKSSVIELSGDYKNQQQSFWELLMVLFMGTLMIFAALLFLFREYRTAGIVFIGSISSVSIIIPGLYISGTLFDVSSFTGIITIMGIVANNGILVMEFVESYRQRGQDIFSSLISAGTLRLRPVLITNLTTFAGFLPLALNAGGGGEILRPFATAIIFGLSGSVFFSLFIMPVLYFKFHGKDLKSS